MKNGIVLIWFILFFGGALPTHAHVTPLKQLAFLNGCWTLKEADKTVTEDWNTPMATLMHGSSKTLMKGKVVQEESIEIRWDDKTSGIQYIPTLNGKRLNTFVLDQTQSTMKDQAVFVDPNNKTLKKLIYTLKSKAVLNIRLSGHKKDGQPFDFEYDMNRDACPRSTTN